MMTRTSTLLQPTMKQSDSKQSNANNGSGRGAMLRSMLPNLLINAGIPFMINMLARPYMSTIDALLLASSVPALYTVGSLIVKRRINVLGLIVIAGLLLNATFALLFNSPRILLLQGSAVNGLFGVVMLLSLFFSRPILFYVIRSVVTHNDPQRLANFNADWAFRQVRSFYRVLSIVWGCVTIGQVLLMAVLAFNLPISVMLGIGPILNFAIIIPAAHWSMAYFRKNKPIFDQLRQQRDAVAA